MINDTPVPPVATAEDPDRLPSFAEQVADQLGGWRGLLESSIPVIVFVIVNLITSTLRPAIIVACAVALAIAGWRLGQRRPIRHAVNGLFGVGLGAIIAWNTGEEKDFYLPGILISLGYAIALLASVFARQPLVGWIYSVVADGGKSHWRTDPRLLRTFAWLTLGWAAVYFAKVALQAALYAADLPTALGVTRIALGFPPYALLLAGTVWAVRRVNRVPAPAPAG